MASVLDLGLLNYFAPVFAALLVMVIMFAFLEKLQFISKSTPVNMLIALLLAVLFVMVPELTTIVALATPWFVISFIFLLFLILMFLFMGVKENVIAEVFSGDKKGITWVMIIVSFLIFGYAFTQVYGEQIHNITAGDSTSDSDLAASIGQIIFTPKVLGMMLLIVVAGFAVQFISQSVITK